jgi:hypothetical protein
MTHEKDRRGVRLKDSTKSLVEFSQFAASGNDGKLRIYSGELHCDVYDSDQVIEAFKAAHEQGVLIQIIAGPILSVREENRRSRIIELATSHPAPIVELYFRSKRLTDPHYYIASHNGNKPEWKIRAENAHEALAPPEKRSLLQVPDSEAFEWAVRFDMLIQNGGDQRCELKKSLNPVEDFILMTPSEIENAKVLAPKYFKGRQLDDLVKEEIERLPYRVMTKTTLKEDINNTRRIESSVVLQHENETTQPSIQGGVMIDTPLPLSEWLFGKIRLIINLVVESILHPNEVSVLNRKTGKIIRREKGQWWPN